MTCVLVIVVGSLYDSCRSSCGTGALTEPNVQ